MKMLKLFLAVVMIAVGMLLGGNLRAAPAGTATSAPAVKGQIQREAERQGLVGERMRGVIERFGNLVRDLHSNGYLTDAQTQQLNQMAGNLQDLNQTHVRAAADALHQATEALGKTDPALKAASLEVEIILRELSTFLMRANAAQARAMLLAELRDLIAKEQALQTDTIGWGRLAIDDASKAADQGKTLASTQEILAGRTGRFVDELQVAQNAESDPLGALRIGNAKRVLVDRQVVSLLQGATTDIRDAAAIVAVGKQTEALKGMREAEAILAPDREMQNLLKAREDIRRILEDQVALRKDTEKTLARVFADARNDLYVRQHGLTTRLVAVDAAPFNPAPENEPVKAVVPATVPAAEPAVDAVTIALDINPVTGALGAMGEAEKALDARQQAETVTAQKKAEAYLVRALAIADALLAKMNTVNTLAAAVEHSRRTVDMIRQFQALHAQIMEATARAISTNKDATDIGRSQAALATAVSTFIENLQPSAYAEPIKRALTAASKAMVRAAEPLGQNKPTAAQVPQAEAAKALAEALALAEQELENAIGKYDAAKKSEDNRAMGEKIAAVAGQQKGLLDEAKKNDPNGQPPATQPMATTQAALAAATTQMATQSENEPMNIALDKTSKEMDKATQALQQPNMPSAPKLAAPYMKEALDTLKVAKAAADDQATESDITGEMAAEIEKIDVKVLNLLQRQTALREETEKADIKLLPTDMAGEQTVLLGEATAVSEGEEIIGKDLYAKAAVAMKEAIGHLGESKRPEAVEAQKRAEKELADVEKALRDAMKKITTLEDSDEEATPEEKGPPHPPTIDVVTKTLMVAAKERNLRMQARHTASKDLPPLATDQDALKEITDTLGSLKGGAVAQEFFDAASGHMTKASGSLKQAVIKDAAGKMQDAEIELRKALVALAKNMKPQKPHPPKPEPPHASEPTMEPNPDPQEGERSFTRKDPEGEKVQKDTGRWQSLGPREREAVNQNFSRDLPVEYREMLKDYYESLAKQKTPQK